MEHLFFLEGGGFFTQATEGEDKVAVGSSHDAKDHHLANNHRGLPHGMHSITSSEWSALTAVQGDATQTLYVSTERISNAVDLVSARHGNVKQSQCKSMISTRQR